MNEESTIIKLSPLALGLRLFMVVFLIDTLYALLFILYFYFTSLDFGDFSNGLSSGFITFLWIVHTLKFAVIAFFLIKFVTDHLETNYIVTKSHLKVEKGAITTKSNEYELKQLKEINIYQGPTGKILHYGDIELQFGALGFHKIVRLHEISNPHKYQRQLRTYLDN